MKPLTLDQTREIQLKLLISFDKWCNEHSIHYSLGEGSLIGAIRHRGFIPWDDDIDLLMPREDYDRFISTYDGEYRLINYHTEKRWRFCFSRLSDESTFVRFNNPKKNYHGLWISLFPIDNFPDDTSKWNDAMKKIRVYQWIGRKKDSWWIPQDGVLRNSLKCPMRFLLSPFTYNWLAKQQECQIIQFNKTQTKRKGFLACVWHDPWVCPAEVFDGFVNVEFEGRQFPAIIGYDTYLKCQYGDYMQLPPEEKRVAKHDYTAYLID